MNWLWFIPILLIMVVIHEMGHFLTARYFGMKVHEFGIGFPPKVWSKKTKDGMEWSINALPIGGFVRIEGENGDSDDPNAFGSKPTWQRAIVLAAGPFMNIVLAFTLFFVVTAIGGKTVAEGRPAITEVAANSPAAAAGLQAGDVFVSINGKPTEAISDLSIETALDKNNPIQLVMDRNGQQYSTSVMPRKNPPEGEGAIGVGLGNSYGSNGLQIMSVKELNKQLGLTGTDAFQDKDQIVTVDGKVFTNNIELVNYMEAVTKPSVTLVVKRDGQTISHEVPMLAQITAVYKNSSANNQKLPNYSIVTRLDDTPIHNKADYVQYLTANAGKQINLFFKKGSSSPEQSILLLNNTSLDAKAENRAPRVNTTSNFYLYLPSRHISYNPIEAASDGWKQTYFAITLIPRTFKGLFDGSVAVSNLAGPIGMAQITDTVITQGQESGGLAGMFRSLALLMAMLSVNLGVVNILPLPALDGGRLIFVFIEMLTRGKRVPPEREGLVHLVGMMALLTMMVAISWQDILRLISGGGFQ